LNKKKINKKEEEESEQQLAANKQSNGTKAVKLIEHNTFDSNLILIPIQILMLIQFKWKKT